MHVMRGVQIVRAGQAAVLWYCQQQRLYDILNALSLRVVSRQRRPFLPHVVCVRSRTTGRVVIIHYLQHQRGPRYWLMATRPLLIGWTSRLLDKYEGAEVPPFHK